MSIRHVFTGILVLVLTLTVSPLIAMAATETFHETYAVKSGTPVTVTNRNGAIAIAVWDKDTVDVVAVKKTHLGGSLNDVEIRVNTGETLSIETVYLVNNPRVSIEYTISVPASIPITLAESSNGAITLKGTSGDVDVHTSNGAIKIQQHTGNVSARTSNGAIDIQRISGVVKAHTSNGSISIVGTSGIEKAETSNGSIKAEIVDIVTDELALKTSNGSVKVFLSPSLNADLDVKTSNGKITIHDIEILTTSVSKTAFKGRIGNGGNLLTIKTSNGSIDVYQLQ